MCSSDLRLAGLAFCISAFGRSFWERQGLDRTGHDAYKVAHLHRLGVGHPESRVTLCFVVRPQACMLSRGGEPAGYVPLDFRRTDQFKMFSRLA